MNTLTPPALTKLLDLACNGVRSPHSQRSYKGAVVDYYQWWLNHQRPELTKASVLAWRVNMERRGLSSATVSLRLSAMRKLASEAADAGLISHADAAAIARAKAPRRKGTRMGTRLTTEQAEQVLDQPDAETLTGKRDRAVLALLIGAGLRREEVGKLQVSDFRQVDGRWIIADLTGKGDRSRTIPIADWIHDRIRAYWDAGEIRTGAAIRAHAPQGHALARPIGVQGVYRIVKHVAKGTPMEGVAPHDMRRTFAHLALKGGAPLDQIQMSLGHQSIQTTELYLGARQDLVKGPSDFLAVRPSV